MAIVERITKPAPVHVSLIEIAEQHESIFAFAARLKGALPCLYGRIWVMLDEDDIECSNDDVDSRKKR